MDVGINIWVEILSAVVVLFVYLLVKNKKRLPLPPGPKALPIVGHLHLLGNDTPHKDLCLLARKHGPIMSIRLGLVPTVVVSSPDTAELVLKTHDLIFANRPAYHQAANYLVYGQRSITSSNYGPYLRSMRKLCAIELLSQPKINQFQSMRREELGLFISQLKQASEMHQTVDLSARTYTVGVNMICLMVLGRKYADKDMGDMGFKSLIMETMKLSGRFNLADYFPFFGALDLQGFTRRVKHLRKTFDPFLEKIIEDRKSNNTTSDFVETMMAIMESGEAGFEFDRRHVKGVILDLLVAGMDTSPTVVEWVMSELLRHPNVMKKLQQELESVVGMDHMVEESHLERLEYLDLVIKEVLRLHPIVPLLLPHESAEDCVVQGLHIPKKSRIIVNVYAIGRDPNVWADPERFLPERFIGSNIDMRGHNFELLPFGSGRRGCPGLQLGLLLVRMMVAQLVHGFDWELPSGMLPENLDMSEHFGLVTARAKHLKLIPTYRLTK